MLVMRSIRQSSNLIKSDLESQSTYFQRATLDSWCDRLCVITMSRTSAAEPQQLDQDRFARQLDAVDAEPRALPWLLRRLTGSS